MAKPIWLSGLKLSLSELLLGGVLMVVTFLSLVLVTLLTLLTSFREPFETFPFSVLWPVFTRFVSAFSDDLLAAGALIPDWPKRGVIELKFFSETLKRTAVNDCSTFTAVSVCSCFRLSHRGCINRLQFFFNRVPITVFFLKTASSNAISSVGGWQPPKIIKSVNRTLER